VKLYWYLVTLSCIFPLFAAAPVVHVYFAELYLKKHKPHYTQKERDAFIVGTLFPDIRYLAHIDRKKTHTKNVILSDIISTKDPFTAGKIFHSFVDEQREKIARREKIYRQLKDIPEHRRGKFLKMVEDELCYRSIDASQARAALKTFDKGEEQFGIPFYLIRAWHKYLRSYLAQLPLTLLKKRATEKQRYFMLNATQVKELSSLLEIYKKNEKVSSYVNTLITDFEKALELK
jgi:hypothetical protein